MIASGRALVGVFLLLGAGCATAPEAVAPPRPEAARDHDPTRPAVRSPERLRAGVRLVLDGDPEPWFPPTWLRRPVFGSAEPLEPENAERARGLVAAFLDRYPESLLRGRLARVHVVRRLEFYRRSFGGTNARDAVFVTLRSPEEGYDDDFVLGLLHAEFSSILLREDAALFPREDFLAANPVNFEYSGTGIEVLLRKDLLEQDEALLARGFLSRYATSSFENDVNSFARWLMTRPEELAALSLRWPRIARKSAALREFFSSLGIPLPPSPGAPRG